MNVEELLRQDLHSQAAAVAPIENLLETTTALGRRKQRGHWLAIGGGAVAAAAAVVAGALVLGTAGSGPTAKVTPAVGGSDSPDASSQPVWWQSWTEGRHFGPVDNTFLTNARPTYDPAKGPESITVWATGSEPDGTDWAMYTDPADGHTVQWIQGWDGTPDYGEADDVADHATWLSWTTPTLDSHNDASSTSQYLVVVGRPGTTSISYAADGSDFTDLAVKDGIAVVRLPKFPPAAAEVRLADADGVYATGVPAGAGAGAEATSSPTPGSGTTPQ